MNAVLYTQRVEFVKSYGERRDCADQRIPQFLAACSYLPLPLPNVPYLVEPCAEQVNPIGIFLTGGNSLVAYGGDAPERDKTEHLLTEWGLAHGVPLFGICRGMQFLASFFGGVLASVEGHAGTRHAVAGTLSRRSVNSYHTLALWEVPKELDILARAEDGSIEAFRHKKHRVMGIGWHAEREAVFVKEDLEMVRGFFGREPFPTERFDERRRESI